MANKNKSQQLGNILSELDLQLRPSISHSLSSVDSGDAFGDVAKFLNIGAKPKTLYDLRAEFTSHANLFDEKDNTADIGDDLLESDDDDLFDDNDDDDDDPMYSKEQFLTFIHSSHTLPNLPPKSTSIKSSGTRSPTNIKQYSLSTLSRSIIKPIRPTPVSPPPANLNINIVKSKVPTGSDPNIMDDKKDIVIDNDPNHLNLNQLSAKPDALAAATSIPVNIFADPSYICTKHNKWKFGFVQTNAPWRPEFTDVMKFKQFNLKTGADIFRNGNPFKLPDKTHKKWKNIYWFFDNRSQQTIKQQKDATSGMKKYLNDYNNSIMIKYEDKYGRRYKLSEYSRNECFKLIEDDDAIDTNIVCGVLRAYCNCDVIEWKYDININQLKQNNNKIKCISCHKEHKQHKTSTNTKVKNDIDDDDNKRDIEMDNECYWIQGTSIKHNNSLIFLCGKCIISLVIEGSDPQRIDIYQYLSSSLLNSNKIMELCLVHRLFAPSSQLMQLLINSFCRHWEDNSIAGMLKVINFCIKWITLLWFEDFPKKSKSRNLLNKFISFLLQQTNNKNEYIAIWKATQKLIKHYRDQYLLQQQINETLEANGYDQLLDAKSKFSSKSRMVSLNTYSHVSTSYFDGDTDDDDDDNSSSDNYLNGLFKDNDNKTNARIHRHKNKNGLIPPDLAWYKTNYDEDKEKFFKYVLQKRNSIEHFRKYQNKELKLLKNNSKSSNNLKQKYNRKRLQSVHVLTPNNSDNKKNNKKNSKKNKKIKFQKKRNKSDQLNVIKTYDIPQTTRNSSNTSNNNLNTSSAWNIFNSSSATDQHTYASSYNIEFAEQLTLIAFDLFKSIRPTEFLRKAWTRKDKHLLAPNIAELIIFMESVTIWAKFEIIICNKMNRKSAIERICRIGIELYKLRNQYGSVQIYLALISSDLKYFKNDLQILFQMRELKLFMNTIEKLINHSKNHSELRSKLWNLSAPAIPFLGVFLKDAFQADELLNISKLQKVNPKQMELLFNVYNKIELFRNVEYSSSSSINKNDIIIKYIQRQLNRAKKLNVRQLTFFCKHQSIKEKNKNERKKKKTLGDVFKKS